MSKSSKQLIASILAVVAISFAFPAFAQYTPMVRIPGLPATGSISLSMYLVGLYNFLVSIVGIVAVMMMIVGGMRYITAGGSSSAIGDAKDIISNAVAGLVIAIFAWVIVVAINPPIKKLKHLALILNFVKHYFIWNRNSSNKTIVSSIFNLVYLFIVFIKVYFVSVMIVAQDYF